MKIDVTRKITDLFETENDLHLMDFKTKSGIPVWMIGRYYLMDYIVSSKVFSSVAPVRHRRLSFKTMVFLMKAFFKNIKNWKLKNRRQIVLYSTNRKTLINNKFFNRYVDYFAKAKEDDSYIIEQAMLDWEWPYPRMNNNVVFDTIARVKSEIYGRFHKRRYYKVVTDLVEYYFERVKRILEISFTDREKFDIVKYISNLICVSEYMARWVEKRLTAATKIFIMVGAGFPYNYPINVILKKHNVISVELQHGYITKTSVMYNYADKILESNDIVAGLPDYFLTYGEWWNRQMNCPIKKISIGNPHHDYCLSFNDVSHHNKKNIVVLGSGQNTDKYIELTESIMAKFQDFNVIFRPHPGEDSIAREIVDEKGSNVRFDENFEIYDTLKQAFVVISEITTVLFEAVGVVKKIIVWNNDYAKAFLPDHPFDSFERVEELQDIIYGDLDKEYKDCEFWSEDCLQRYKNFVDLVLSEN